MSWKNFSISSFKLLNDVKIIKPEIGIDEFSEYTTLYDSVNHPCSKFFDSQKNIRNKIVISDKGIEKKFHWDDSCWKLITCIKGKIKLNVVDVNENSHFFGIDESYTLSDINNHQVLIPPFYANSYKTLKNSIVNYFIFYENDYDDIKQNIYNNDR